MKTKKCPQCQREFQTEDNYECCSRSCGLRLRWKRKSFNRPVSNETRFWKKVRKTPGCWIWEGMKRLGYGRFSFRKKEKKYNLVSAHRFAFESLHGEIPAGLTLDHLCRNPACVRPSHLEIVSLKENVHRGISPSANNHRKTECKNGHPFIEGNFKWVKGGKRPPQRVCRICKKEYDRIRHLNS